jgi:tetratricopeptide (TPR) repeat protein
MAEAVDHPASLMFAYYGIGLLSLRQDDLPRALSLLERATDICHEADLRTFFPRIAAPLGTAYALCGHDADTEPLLTQAMEHSTAAEIAPFETLCSLSLGEAHRLAGRLDEGQVWAERALAFAPRDQARSQQAQALHLLGDIAAHHGPPEVKEADASYRQALTLTEKLGMRPLQAHCHRGLGTLYANTGRPERASGELSTALALYRILSGEGGIGKSRLVEMLRQRVVGEGSPGVVLRCSPYHSHSALYPVIEHLQRELAWRRDETPAAKLDTLEHTLQVSGLALNAVVLCTTLLSAGIPEGRYPLVFLTPSQQRQRTLDALVAWLLAAADRQPSLVVWENLHWADPSTLELVGLMID